MAGIPKAFGEYLNKLFTELNKEQDPPTFSCSPGTVNSMGYSRTVCFVADKEEYHFSLCCCEDTKSNEAHLFFGAYVIDALVEELQCVLSERGEQFLAHDNAPLFEGLAPNKGALSLRKLAEQRLDEDLYRSYGIDFNVIDCLSMTNYEQERAKGNLVFLPTMPNQIEHICTWCVCATNRVECSIKNLRVLRKFLAGTASETPDNDDLALLFVKGEELAVFCGAVPIKEGIPFPNLQSGCVQVRIHSPLTWDLLLFGKLVCHRNASGLCLPNWVDYLSKEKVEKERIQNAIKAAFTKDYSAKMVEKHIEDLTCIVQSVQKQRHGAALVIADWSRELCQTTLDRLKRHNKAVPVAFTISEAQISAITSAAKMDGAILADISSGQIIAVATIMDGQSCVKGDTSRGSRYNSIANATALLRLSESDPEVVSFVFSSDGGTSILT